MWGSLRRLAAKFSHEPRFAHAGLTHYAHHLSLSPGHVRPDGVQRGQLPRPADKGRPGLRRVWHGGRTAHTLSQYLIDSPACRLPIHRRQRHGLEAHHPPHQARGSLTAEDGPRPGMFLEDDSPRHGIANDHGIPSRGILHSPPRRPGLYGDPCVPAEPLCRRSPVHPALQPVALAGSGRPTRRAAHDLPAPQGRQRPAGHHRLRSGGTCRHTAGLQDAPAHAAYGAGVARSPGIRCSPCMAGVTRAQHRIVTTFHSPTGSASSTDRATGYCGWYTASRETGGS